MAQISTSRQSDQYPIRLPDGMRDEIKTVAKANQRSMNAEIVARLSESFGSSKTLRDEFAMSAPAVPDDYRVPDAPPPEYPQPLSISEIGKPTYDEDAVCKYWSSLVIWQARRAAAWRYAFADAMLAERAKGGA